MKKILEFLTPKWVTQKWAEGSEGASQKKSTTRFVIGATAVFAVIYAMLYFNLFGTYLHQYFVRAGFVAHVISVVAALGSIYAIWKAPDVTTSERGGWIPGALILALLALAIAAGAGFDFNLFGIEK